MGLAASKAYIPSDHDNNPDINQKVDANVICIGFSILKKDHEKLLATGDPIFCTMCKASISFLSKLEPMKEDQKQMVPNKKVWTCEFCGFENIVSIDEEEIPKNSDVIYMVQSANQMKQNNQDDSDISIIYCIDNSGSMSVTKEIDGKHNLKHGESISETELEELKQFMEPWEYAQIVKNLKKSKTTFVTRKNCVIAAVENQLLEMSAQHPKRKAGLVVFNDDVTIVGDGSEGPIVVAGDKLLNYELIEDLGKKIYDSHMKLHCDVSMKLLANTLEKLKETGKTALGPALLSSISLASRGKPGSTVVVCTDGLANVGLGSFEGDSEKTKEFYESLELLAKNSGVTVSLVTIIGEQCKLDVLGQIVVNTNGTITRMNPEDLIKNFGNALKDEIIATNVEAKLLLNRAIKFRNEDEKNLFDEGSLCVRNIGNVTDKSEITFEYQVKSKEELKKLNIDLSNLKQIPFQSQIFFNSKEGHRFVRVMTRKQEVTHNVEEVQKDVKIGLLAARAKDQAANLALKGNLKQAEEVSNKWEDYMECTMKKKISPQLSKKTYESFVEANKKNITTFNEIKEITDHKSGDEDDFSCHKKQKIKSKPAMVNEKMAGKQKESFDSDSEDKSPQITQKKPPMMKQKKKVKHDLDEKYEGVLGMKAGNFVGRTEEDID